MTVRGKHGKPKAGFPPFPLPLEIPQNRRDFHIPTASATTIWTWTGPKTCPKPSTQGVGQNKLPNWAKCSCQTHQNVCAIRDSVQQRLAKPGIRDYLRPFRKRQIRRHDDRRSFNSLGNYLEQKLGPYFGQRHIAHFINRDQFIAAPASHYSP